MPGGDFGKPEMSGRVGSSCAEVGDQPFFHLKPSQCFSGQSVRVQGVAQTSFWSLYVYHRFDQPAQKCVSCMPDEALFDLPRSDGRQLYAPCIVLLNMRPSLRSDIGTQRHRSDEGTTASATDELHDTTEGVEHRPTNNRARKDSTLRQLFFFRVQRDFSNYYVSNRRTERQSRGAKAVLRCQRDGQARNSAGRGRRERQWKNQLPSHAVRPALS